MLLYAYHALSGAGRRVAQEALAVLYLALLPILCGIGSTGGEETEYDMMLLISNWSAA